MDPHHNIPGTTPLEDISGLKIKGLKDRQRLYEYEFKNTLKATVKYLSAKPSRRMAPFSLRWVLGLHREMLGEVWAWAGKLRDSNVNIGVDWHQVEVGLKNLLDDLDAWQKTGMDPVEQSARLHHRAVQIHPFKNGNGRWARLLANIWLKREGCPIIRWPESDISEGVSGIRDTYLRAIRQADNGDYQPLITLHTSYLENSESSNMK